LEELSLVVKGYNSSEITNEEYANQLADEATVLFKNATYLEFKSISLKSLQIALKNHKLQDILYISSIILSENQNYLEKLYQKVRAIITSTNSLPTITPANFDELNEVLKYLLIELHQSGYSKAYLHFFISAIFHSSTAGTFENRLNIIGSLISRPRENYQVIVGFVITPTISTQLEILDPALVKINSAQIQEISEATNRKVKDFFLQFRDTTFYKVELSDRDYYSASNQVRKNLQLVLDVLHMGYSSEEFMLNPKCVVIGSVNPRMAGIHNLNYQLEGYFKNDQELYRQFSERIKSIKEKGLSQESLVRIEAALRFLRLGSSVKELENKLLNYWIGMEYFFSSSDAKTSKTNRMREFFKRIHGKVYFKRLLLDFHQSIKSFSLGPSVANFGENLVYLTAQASFQTIEANPASPLLAYRAYRLSQKLFTKKTLSDELLRHATKLEWNLLRIYRVRNAVVHSAAVEANILDITSHLRYYLIFVINSAVDYLDNNPVDINKDGKLNLDDYFLVNKVEFDDLIVDDALDVQRLIKIRNPIEFLS
jgi:hypothetical protein